jgi:serine/threonine-protein kinase
VYIKRCLYKDPRQRVGDMRDMRLVLEGAFETDVSPNAATANAQPIGRRLLPFAAGVVLAGAVAALVAWSLWPSAEPRPVTRFAYDIPAGTEGWASRSMIAVAPDGRTAVVSTSNGLYIQAMDALEGRLIPGTSGFTAGLFFSVDGKWIGYWDANARALMRISLSGGPPILIAASAGPYGSSWSADGTILFAVAEGIMRIASTGGMPDLVIKANDGERIDGPGLLPDGESVLFSVTTATGDTRWDQAKIVVQSLRTGARTVVLEGGSDARYLRTGHLVYARGTTLFAVPFDVGRLSVTGSAVPVAEGLSRADRPVVDTATANYGVSDDGTLVYATRGSYADQRLLVWVDRQGREEPLPAPPRPYVYPRISPDGARIALRIRDQQRDIWTWDLARETLTRLTFTSGEELYAIWTPDSRRLLFDSSGDNERQSQNVFWQAADGTGAAERLTDSRDRPRPFAISPDGNRVVLRVGVTPPYDLGVLLLGNPRRTEPLLTTPFNETNAEVSPDGRWLAYDSNESGRSEVYVRPFPNVDGGRWQVSRDGGTRPVWARDGRDLFYLVRDGADAVFMSVRVESGQTWTTGTVTRLFAGRYFADDAFGGPGQGRTYDVGADGRFLMLRDASPSESAGPTTRLIVVQHWDEELKRLVPTN